MITAAIERLRDLCDIIPPLLVAMDKADLSFKQAPDKWSKKEIIGHLIDSAANNHQRFVRAQFEDKPVIVYDQNNWNHYSHHQQISSEQLIDFWTIYNRQLAALVSNIPEENLQRTCITGGKPLTLAFLFEDYVAHLEHHLRQIVAYS